MAKGSYHVIARSDGNWSVKRTGAERISGNYSSKKEAVTTAKRLATASGGGELIIHARDGRVSDRFKARDGRNPATGAVIKIPAGKTIRFKPGKNLSAKE